jgi:hypothetical protein
MFFFLTYWFAAGSTRDVADYLDFIFAAGIGPGRVIWSKETNNFTTQSYGYMPWACVVAYY